LVYRLVGHLWKAQRKGDSLSSKELLELEERASERQVQSAIQHLLKACIVTRNSDERWMLARDLEEVTLGALYHCGNYYLPLAEEDGLPIDGAWDRTFIASLAMLHDQGEEVLNRSLREMYMGSGESMKNQEN